MKIVVICDDESKIEQEIEKTIAYKQLQKRYENSVKKKVKSISFEF